MRVGEGGDGVGGREGWGVGQLVYRGAAPLHNFALECQYLPGTPLKRAEEAEIRGGLA